ncbi:TerD family protein [Histomonas meleagridis]|uniref:TerD family protein n=1 Tax=Histomonas meleagridis TaxID=135588 RepID=UPI003559586A|nr:TerD family protein [Histomonas meleagridis]KAH0800410.1 TerD family protein [Histomonas meleagridis]
MFGFGMGMPGMGGMGMSGGPNGMSAGFNVGGMSMGMSAKIGGTRSAPTLSVDMGSMGMGFSAKDIPLCTHDVHPGNWRQNLYECRTCNKKICENCARNCHDGHDVVFYCKEEVFECACDNQQKCTLIDHENHESHAVPESQVPPEPEVHAVMAKGPDGKPRLELDPLHSLTIDEAAKAHNRNPPTSITVGCGWLTKTDLDTQIVAYDKDLKILGSVSFRNKDAFAGALHHFGDNRQGSTETNQDAEKIKIDLSKMPANVKSLAISITSFGGLPFTAVSKAYMRLTDSSDNFELMYLELSAKEKKTALFFALLYRGDDGKWELLPAIKYFDAKTPEQSFAFTSDYIKKENFIQRMHGNK